VAGFSKNLRTRDLIGVASVFFVKADSVLPEKAATLQVLLALGPYVFIVVRSLLGVNE